MFSEVHLLKIFLFKMSFQGIKIKVKLKILTYFSLLGSGKRNLEIFTITKLSFISYLK